MTKPTKASKALKPGRPSDYTQAVADEILRRLAAGETLRGICRDEHLPHEATVRGWALEDREGFKQRYSEAREIGYHSMADEVLEIVDDGRNDWMKREDGSDVVNSENIQRSRLRFDGRRWLLSKALPKIYGDKITQELTGADGAPLVPVINVNVSKS